MGASFEQAMNYRNKRLKMADQRIIESSGLKLGNFSLEVFYFYEVFIQFWKLLSNHLATCITVVFTSPPFCPAWPYLWLTVCSCCWRCCLICHKSKMFARIIATNCSRNVLAQYQRSLASSVLATQVICQLEYLWQLCYFLSYAYLSYPTWLTWYWPSSFQLKLWQPIS